MAEEIKRTSSAGVPSTQPDPLSAMRGEFDRFIDRMMGGSAIGRGFPTFGEKTAALPTVDVRENNTEIVIEAELPGLAEADTEVSLRDGVLTIKGEKTATHDETKDDVHVSERRYGRFSRAFRVPDGIDEASISAVFDKGVLTVRLPKSAESAREPRKIPIGKA